MFCDWKLFRTMDWTQRSTTCVQLTTVLLLLLLLLLLQLLLLLLLHPRCQSRRATARTTVPRMSLSKRTVRPHHFTSGSSLGRVGVRAYLAGWPRDGTRHASLSAAPVASARWTTMCGPSASLRPPATGGETQPRCKLVWQVSSWQVDAATTERRGIQEWIPAEVCSVSLCSRLSRVGFLVLCILQ